MAKTQDTSFRVRIKPRLPGDDSISVPHKGTELVVAHPIYGPNSALYNQEAIETDNQKLALANSPRRIRQATTGEVIAVVHPAYKGSFKTEAEQRVADEITHVMDKKYFRGHFGILYHPDIKLAYFAPVPKLNEQSVVDTSDLVRRVESGREVFQSVPFSEIREGIIDPPDLLKLQYVLAFAEGGEGTQKLVDLANKTPAKQARLWIPNLSGLRKPEARVATLLVDGAYRLDVVGNNHGIDGDGYALGVLDETGEASAPKI